MTFSTEIIKILDDLCRRFGIAIDWTSENVLPYIEDLCSRYIQYEIYTSLAWCALLALIVVICFIVWLIALIIDHATTLSAGDIQEMFGWFTIIALGIGLIVWGCQAFDIIECYTLPEKTLIEYVSTLMDRR